MAGNRVPGLRPGRLTRGEPTAHNQQSPGRLAALRRAAARLVLHPSRDQATSYIAIGAVGALLATTVVVGAGAASTVPLLSDIGAWLGSSNGTAVHVNGLTGQVDGRVGLPGMKGHQLQLSQDGKSILVMDERTGRLVRIDPSQLTVGATRDAGTAGMRLFASGGVGYLVDQAKGTVQQIDKITLAPTGPRHDLGAPLGRPAVDPEGTLWVPIPARGQVVPVRNGTVQPAVKVADAGHPLLLTLAGGKPVVTDPVGAVTMLISASGPRRKVTLPSTLAGSDPDRLLVPAVTEGSEVPVLAAGRGALVVIDLDSGAVRAIPLDADGHRLHEPQVLANRVYVPDQTDGTLLVYDTAKAQFEEPIRVTGRKGKLEAFVRNGLLWVNDQNNAAAAVVNADGEARPIGKYETNVPGGSKKKAPKPPKEDSRPPDNPPDREPLPERTPDPEPTQVRIVPEPPPAEPTPSQPPAQQPPVLPPGTPTAQSGPGSITIDFAPAAGAQPSGYRLQGTPAGAAVQPNQIGPGGPFRFEVTGGNCGQEYGFRVVAVYPGGRTSVSPRSTPVRPCVAPGQPRDFAARPIASGGHGGDLSWNPPTGAQGSDLSYRLTWPGGQRDLQGTQTRVEGLANGQQYAFSVTASNSAGSGAGAAGATLDLTPPSRRIPIHNNRNDGNTLGVRNLPSHETGGRAGSIASGATPTVTVHCQVRGSRPQDSNNPSHWSNIWDKVTLDSGLQGWISDIYVATSNSTLSDTFSPELWQCT
jgi:hypothetical protein